MRPSLKSICRLASMPLPMPWIREVSSARDQVGHLLRQRLNGLRLRCDKSGRETILPVDLQQIGSFVENEAIALLSGDGFVVHPNLSRLFASNVVELMIVTLRKARSREVVRVGGHSGPGVEAHRAWSAKGSEATRQFQIRRSWLHWPLAALSVPGQSQTPPCRPPAGSCSLRW
jgi:hypothetical protein